jgi:hypothetical protein
MAQSVRIEFVELGEGGAPQNIIRGLNGVAINNLAVGNTATTAGNRPQAPAGGRDKWGVAVRLTAKTNPVFVAWGTDPTATLTNSLQLAVGIPEVIYVKDGDKLSFIAEQA